MQASQIHRRALISLRKRVKELFISQAHLPYIGPLSLWVIVFVIAPLGLILYFSFLTSGPMGKIIHTFTLENYRNLADIKYIQIFLRSFLFAFTTSAVCLLIGYSFAYWIVNHKRKWKITLLFLVIMPSWTCYLIRVYALKTLAGNMGIINNTLLSLDLISSPLQILYTPAAVVMGLVYTWLPFMILPIYASLDGLDPSLLEAAFDLGATPFQRFLSVTLPLTKGGLAAGIILVFIPSLGAWLIPELLGGGKTMMAGNIVTFKFITVGNVPGGSCIALVLAAVVILLIYFIIKLAGEEALEKIV